mmetsp:Transcript_5051/g.10405  ORF Transcript_5051/g.10405 Transcript_5051/m.10405 type:complete len:92 (-) Transcript_5051:267-542(-)
MGGELVSGRMTSMAAVGRMACVRWRRRGRRAMAARVLEGVMMLGWDGIQWDSMGSNEIEVDWRDAVKRDQFDDRTEGTRRREQHERRQVLR